MRIGTMKVVCLSFLLLLVSCNAAQNDGVYIVYMGSAVSENGAPRNDHALLLSSLIKREKNSVVQTYRNGFTGFAARLSEEEAKSIAGRAGVVSVFPDPVLELHTTRSWDFLKYQTALKIDSNSPTSSAQADTIIGIIDTGIWPEAESFRDDGIGEIPARWKGKCMEGINFTAANCNRKVIGARYYDDPSWKTKQFGTPRDEAGHGTHVSSTAAGMPVSGASYYGLAKGTAAGGSPTSRIAMYRVCLPNGGCIGSAILKAFDDAIADGVDVLSLSLGSSPGMPDFSTDPIAIGSFHAVEKGITVVCSAGNSGPSPSTVTNVAPWIFTIAATTIDRDFQVDVVLGGANKVIKGGGINLSNLNKSANYPLIDGLSAKSASSDNDEANARNCVPTSLDGAKLKGKIVVCGNKDLSYAASVKFEFLKSQDAVGMILIDNDARQIATNYKTAPIAAVTEEDGSEIYSYINSTSNPTATILPTVITPNYKPAPVVGYFSSRGPINGLKNLLKPDIAAPGVAILAAWPSNAEPLPGKKEAALFNIISGTSMACPHVSGLAAAIKSQHPTWSPSAIRSAIMTTAIQTNNLHEPITTNTGSRATPHDIGAGEIDVSGPLQPGLVYETESIDYLHFLCNIGYTVDKIKNIASSLPSNFSCLTSSDPDSISNMNYPSISVSGLRPSVSKAVSRTVSNVGEEDSSYTAVVESPSTLEVGVVPNKLVFSKDVTKLSFQVRFKLSAASKEDLFGSITWTNEKFKVRSPFVVSNTK